MKRIVVDQRTATSVAPPPAVGAPLVSFARSRRFRAVGVEAPVAASKVVKVLKGHSGCMVELRLSEHGYFVRKTSGSRTYDDRLRRQAEKQRAMAGLVRTPAVLREGRSAGRAFFDMEYVRGLDFKAFALSGSLIGISQTAESLFRLLARLAGDRRSGDLTSAVVRKLDDLGASFCTSEHDRVRNLVAVVNSLKRFDYRAVPATPGHGDLTLENLLFCEDGLVFIDFLDGDLESVWLDFAKLSFDLEFGWSVRSIADPFERRLLGMFSRFVSDQMKETMQRDFPDLVHFLGALKSLQALRIIPYCSDEATALDLAGYVERLTHDNGLKP